MTPILPSNEGDRPSRLLLGRLASGELDPDHERLLRGSLDARSGEILAEIESCKATLPPLDLSALRARAALLPREIPAHSAPANNFSRFRSLMPLLAIAAALLMALLVVVQPDDAPDIRPKGSGLKVYQLGPQGGEPYSPGAAVGENDMLGFSVAASGHRGVVLLSVDGSGAVSVFYPASGDAPEPLQGEGLVKLPGSVILDDAPGPEIFLAVFDADVSEAKSRVQRAFQSGGHEGLMDLAEEADIDAVAVTRR